jgi:hypothetical protein
LSGFSLVGRDSVEPGDKNNQPRNVALPPKKRKNQTQHDANNDAGDDWEVERAVAALDPDIARQTTKPAGANPAPKQEAKNNDNGAEDDEKFSELRHAKILAREHSGRETTKVANAKPAMRFNGNGGAISRLLRNPWRFENGE